MGEGWAVAFQFKRTRGIIVHHDVSVLWRWNRSFLSSLYRFRAFLIQIQLCQQNRQIYSFHRIHSAPGSFCSRFILLTVHSAKPTILLLYVVTRARFNVTFRSVICLYEQNELYAMSKMVGFAELWANRQKSTDVCWKIMIFLFEIMKNAWSYNDPLK